MTETQRPLEHVSAPADAVASHWTARAPAWALPHLRLSRLDRPVGWQLLLMPCLMGLGVASSEDGLWGNIAIYAVLFLIGAIAMRGAGCTYNDIIDRDIDAQVERTRGRPLPAGQITLNGAWAWLAAQCLVGLAALIALPRTAQIVALSALPLVAAYPFMKRITWWPQAWLGLCFSWGALVAGAAVDDTLTFEILLLFAGCILWVIGYDTIYALQDREDDALVGVRSTARLFGANWRRWTAGFYIGAFFLWGVAAAASGAGLPPIIALAVIGAFGVSRMIDHVDPDNPASALSAFKFNVLIGLAVAAAFAINPVWVSIGTYVRRLFH